MVRFLHTADLQLGMPFRWAEDRAAALSARREESLSELAKLASDQEADFVVVAGDFFDSNTVDDRVVVRACKRLEEFDVPLFILPGNHDACGSPDSIFQRSKFLRSKPDNVFILDKAEPYVLPGGKVVLLPAPLLYRHSAADPTTHLTPGFGREEAPEAIRIGLAHGGTIDFGSSDNVIADNRATRAELDYLALGDWHGLKQIDERTWYSGTPEPTGFKDNNPGYALIVEIDEPGALPDVRPVKTAKTDWRRQEMTLQESQDLERLAAWFDELPRPLDTLVRLEYGGSLSFEEIRRLEEEILSDAKDRLLYLRLRPQGLIPKASPDELDAMIADGFVGATVRKLQEKMNGQSEESATAAHSLQILHRLMHLGGQ